MGVNDPDGEPYPELTREEFIAVLVREGWDPGAAADEWEHFDKPVRLCDLRW